MGTRDVPVLSIPFRVVRGALNEAVLWVRPEKPGSHVKGGPAV
jgi:hypothetical protein